MLITDISGYTWFISRVGHEEGLKRAQDLLQIVINSNSLGLKLCEVEGDAVFFYTVKKLPSRVALMRQIGATYRAFNDYLAQHGLSSELGIKFFVHTGMCEEVRIGGRTKLFGMEVIKIHRLLKGISSTPDYLLITENAHKSLEMNGNAGDNEMTEIQHIGEVSYTMYDESYLLHTAALSNRQTYWSWSMDALSDLGMEISRFTTHFSRLLSPLYYWTAV